MDPTREAAEHYLIECEHADQDPTPTTASPECDDTPPEMADLLDEDERMASLLSQLSDQVTDIGNKIRTVHEHVSNVASQLARIKTDDQVFTDLSRRCQMLVERFYEREVLNPIFLQLIGIADRCRRKESQLEALLRRVPAPRGRRSAFMRSLLSDRQADRIEVETILANFGVTPFESPNDTFVASAQLSAMSMPCDNTGLHGRIARRLQPGYQRHETVIRREYVAVYVMAPTSPNKKENA